MAPLPDLSASPTLDAIYEHYESKEGDPRGYLGGSIIGESCERRLWYGFRWASREAFPGRILRLFETGHREEDRIIENLRAVGVTVYDRDENGQQFRYSEHGGHFSGGIDGVVVGLLESPKTPHLLEAKTHNAKSFADLKKKGVRASKPKHFDQMQTYMRKAKLSRAAYIAVCKDTDDLYLERIEYDAKHSKALSKKALRIIEAPEPLSRINDDPTWFECKFCPAHSTCHGSVVPPVSCRTCAHSTPITEGDGARWMCERYECEIPEDKQRKGCENHLHIPKLVPFAEPVEAGDDWILFQMKDGRRFVASGTTSFPAKDVPHYSSEELTKVDPAAIGDPAIEAARTILEGEVVG